MADARIEQIINDAFPPGSEERRRLDAAADAATILLIEHGYGHLVLEDDTPAQD